ncbi:uncharacterized protein F54H12.2 [Parasteatoda tepidariorum]|uniref:uncharacterized protein F54H12.2 n=1 Tax=Parasteatoda tepidariorum TaxID=114398 RepID=UPI00077FE40B
MALIRNDSFPSVKSELDLFLMPPTQTAIEKGQWSEYHPISNIHDGLPIEFNISGTSEEYLDLSATQLYVKVKVLKDNKPLPENEKISPCNLFFHSLFSQVDVMLNDRTITSSSNTYAYRSYIETLLNYGSDYKKSFLTSECFYKDTAGHLDETDPSKENEGLKKRSSMIAKGKVLEMIGNLHCDLFYQDRLLLNMIDLKLKLIRNKPEFCLISPENAKYQIAIEHASLFVRKVKVSPGVLLGHAKALEKTTAKYPIDRVLCKMYSIPAGSFSFSQDNVFLGQLPKRLVLACVDNDAFNGTYTTNPFNFKHNDVNFIGVYVDGNPVCHKPLTPNYEDDQYIRSYNSLLLGSERLSSNKGIYINRDEFSKGYTLYSFDLSPDLCDGSYLNLIRQGNLRIELKFSKPLPKTISLFVYSEFNSIIEVTKSRSVICDFSV